MFSFFILKTCPYWKIITEPITFNSAFSVPYLALGALGSKTFDKESVIRCLLCLNRFTEEHPTKTLRKKWRRLRRWPERTKALALIRCYSLMRPTQQMLLGWSKRSWWIAESTVEKSELGSKDCNSLQHVILTGSKHTSAWPVDAVSLSKYTYAIDTFVFLADTQKKWSINWNQLAWVTMLQLKQHMIGLVRRRLLRQLWPFRLRHTLKCEANAPLPSFELTKMCHASNVWRKITIKSFFC